MFLKNWGIDLNHSLEHESICIGSQEINMLCLWIKEKQHRNSEIAAILDAKSVFQTFLAIICLCRDQGGSLGRWKDDDQGQLETGQPYLCCNNSWSDCSLTLFFALHFDQQYKEDPVNALEGQIRGLNALELVDQETKLLVLEGQGKLLHSEP